ncbi:hypothetical protein M1M30_gp123 [Maribacter phage Colly_1]|uniref:Uncharacterized protein n=1 Tax=Maribacter phage Colly_1 TaxID=2745691 RepID=A0A8E4UXT7_9CAUD|nr:hypothetical protein M1M30_gp123 [Maribacter phage Colly_1]QQO97222.1 hypothetical protein Colly1_123 [Maribacter phage Colly_1]
MARISDICRQARMDIYEETGNFIPIGDLTKIYKILLKHVANEVRNGEEVTMFDLGKITYKLVKPSIQPAGLGENDEGYDNKLFGGYMNPIFQFKPNIRESVNSKTRLSRDDYESLIS